MDEETPAFVRWMDTPAPPGYCKRKCGRESKGVLCPECLREEGERIGNLPEFRNGGNITPGAERELE